MNISGYDDWKLDNPFHGERTYNGEADGWVGMWPQEGVDVVAEIISRLAKAGFYNVKVLAVNAGDGDSDFVDVRVSFNWRETFDCDEDDLEDEVTGYIILEIEYAGIHPTSIDEVYIY